MMPIDLAGIPIVDNHVTTSPALPATAILTGDL
jgi:hypothetical protein